MIKKVTIRDVASYDSKGVVFDDLQRVNFIFGGNGAGKTTLSRLLAALPDGGVGFTIKGSDNNYTTKISKEGTLLRICQACLPLVRTGQAAIAGEKGCGGASGN